MASTRQFAQESLDLVEEAVHLLRRTPAGDYLVWFLGVGPFTAGVLFFWADMSRAALASSRVNGAALWLALLFLWLKTCQSVFSARLLARATAVADSPWTLKRWLRVFVTQAVLQPSGLILLPATLLLAVPFGWFAAFYQSATVLGDRAEGRSGTCLTLAWRQATLWPGQNHTVLAILSAAWLAATLNAGIALFTLPHLLKMLLGVESRVTLSPLALLNTTFLAVVIALGTLAIDPLTKAIYVLRCFRGLSLASGDDLRARLRRIRQAAQSAALALLLLLGLLLPGSAAAAAAPAPALAPAGTPPVGEFNEAIADVLERAEYTWRAPRDLPPELPEAELGWAKRILKSFETAISKGLKSLERPLRRLFNWIDRLLRSGPTTAGPLSNLSFNFAGFVEFLMWLLVLLVALALAWFAVKVWQRRPRREESMPQPGTGVPDLRAEFVAADQLPEDGWLALAQDLMAKGDCRLALRAFYLAALAHLARREFIRLARFKSNRDYELELRRRARALPAITTAFAGTVRAFDRAWYGGHDVTPEGLAEFAAQVEQVRAA